jgi:adenylate cyclase
VILLTAILVIFLAYHISKPITQLSKEIDKIAQLDLDSEKRVSSPIYEISEFDQAIASMRTALRSFSHYVPSEIAKQLMHNKHEISLQGEKKRISVMFTDIANFTSIAEGLPIETVNKLLAAHFDALSKIILDCGGLIDKYIGDSVMSLWGASQETPDHAVRACRAALLCQVKLSELNEQQKKAGMPAFITRIGINAGLAIVGNFGTAQRMNYSAIGDAVNAASRLQTINKIYGTKIIIGEEVAKDIGNQFLIRPLEWVEVRGKKQKIKIFELGAQYGDMQSIAPTQELSELFSMFTKAYDLLDQGNIEEAKKQFLAIEKIFPEDPPTKLYLDRLKT